MYSEEQKQQLRIDIAKDVIKHIEAKIYQAEHQYLYILAKEDIRSKPSVEALNSTNVCEVCALGALFLNYYQRNERLSDLWMRQYSRDDFEFSYPINQSVIVETLDGVFSYEQLQLIECAYEEEMDFADDVDNYDLVEAAYRFGIQYSDDTQRLISIMQNIVDNNGLFVP